MMCPKCGAYISDDATFCPKCGTAISGGGMNNMMDSGGMQYGGNNGNNGNKGLIILICGIAAAAIFVITAIIAFLLMSGNWPGSKEEETPAPTEAAVVQPTEAPVQPTVEVVQPTPQIVYVETDSGSSSSNNNNYNNPPAQQQPQQQQPQQATGYRTFYSPEYDFSCDYPANFTVYNDNGQLTLYTLHSPDGAGIEKIVAKPNEGETVDSSRREFINAHAGTITYESVGDNYYAYSIQNGNMEYYKYCKFAKGNLYWFEFSYPLSQYDMYDVYINDVYKSFSY